MQENSLPEWASRHPESEQNQILALQGKANSALSRARALEAKAANESRDLTDDELDFCDKQLSAFTAFQNEVDGFKPAGRKTKPEPVANNQFQRLGNDAKPGSFQALFGAQTDRTQFTNLGDFAKAVVNSDPRLFQNASGMGGVSLPEGGAYVPSGFLAGMIDGSLQAEAVRPLATSVAMTTSTMALPIFDTHDRSTGLAGMEPAFSNEGTLGTAQKGKTALPTLSAKKFMILVPTTNELLEDGGQIFSTLLNKYMTESMTQGLDDWFINGIAPSQPLGIVNAGCTVSVAKDASQVAATVTPTNLSGMVSRLAPGSFARAVWLVSPSVLSSLFVMAQVVRNVAGTENVGGFQPGWLSVGPDGSMSMLGRRLIVSDRCQQLGTVGDIILADLSQYLIGLRADARLMVDTSYAFGSDETWFRLTMRVDGMPLLQSPITPRHGTSTLSPFVTLATRS